MPLSTQQEEALVRAASEMPAEQREAFLDTMSAGDPGLRSRLAELLGRLEKRSKAPEAQHLSATVKIEPPPEDEAIGKNIGPYKLLQKIGEGGCGAVYMADQEQPVHRRVAVKVIKLGMDTKAVIARFEAERQALALSDPLKIRWKLINVQRDLPTIRSSVFTYPLSTHILRMTDSRLPSKQPIDGRFPENAFKHPVTLE
jgi:hypothetical protein